MAHRRPPPPPPSSRLADLYSRHRSVLRRLDDLESRMASRAASHRRRATNLIEEVPQDRRSHMRIFVSHRIEGGNRDDDEDDDKKKDAAPAPAPAAGGGGGGGGRPGGKDFSALLHSAAHQSAGGAPPPGQKKPGGKGVRRWTLVIEGGLLVGHLDHESARRVDGRLDAGLPILGCCDGGGAGEGGGDDDDEEEEAKRAAASSRRKAEIPSRDQWRGGTSERENDRDVPPLVFTHLFDRLEVEMRVVKRSDKSAENVETSAVTRSGFGVAPEPPRPEDVAAVKTFTWEKAKSTVPDSHAFFVSYDEESEFKPMGGKVFKTVFNADRILTRIKLYRRQGSAGNYVPSAQMCEAFFPTFVGKKAVEEVKVKDKGGKSKKRKRDRGGSGGGGAGETAAPCRGRRRPRCRARTTRPTRPWARRSRPGRRPRSPAGCSSGRRRGRRPPRAGEATVRRRPRRTGTSTFPTP